MVKSDDRGTFEQRVASSLTSSGEELRIYRARVRFRRMSITIACVFVRRNVDRALARQHVDTWHAYLSNRPAVFAFEITETIWRLSCFD